MSEHGKLMVSLNNAVAYSYVLGWYAGRDGAPTDGGKIQATEKIKEMHPDIVRACNAHEDLLAVCEECKEFILDKYGLVAWKQHFADMEAAIAKGTE